MRHNLTMLIVAGLVALGAAYLVGGRYEAITKDGGFGGVFDRFTGEVYVNGTATHKAPTPID